MGTCNKLLMIGIIVLLLGIQFRMVDSYVLTPKASEFVEKRLEKPSTTQIATYDTYWPFDGPTPPKTMTPPKWLGWSLISVGVVLILGCPRFR